MGNNQLVLNSPSRPLWSTRKLLHQSGFWAVVSLGALLVSLPAVCGQASPTPSVPAAPPPKPSAVIDISGTGYPQLSRTERLGDDANVSLSFVDDSHVLLTFNPKKLFTRNPDCPASHDDRLIHAIVLEIPSGNVVAESDWYLHDHRRYLWSMGSGQFLLRKLNDLYLVDSSLHEKLLLKSAKDLLWVSVTPDHQQIIVETTGDSPKPAKSGASDAKAKQEYVLQFLDRYSLAPQRTLKLDALVSLDGTSTGYADAIHKGDLWLIRYGPTPKERRNITRVRSRGIPRIFYSSNNSLLIGRCCSPDDNYSVTSFSVTGRRLWGERWSQDRYYPATAGSADSGRFAVSTLQHEPYPTETTEPEDNDNSDFGLKQNVQVIDTAGGSIVSSVPVSPVMMSEQNFALSPDGTQLAVLSNNAIEVYKLPLATPEERTKYAALKADVPGLYVIPQDAENEPADGVTANNQAPAQTASADPKPVSSAPVPSASTSSEDPVAATFKTSTQAVAVDVVVTDSKGLPVKGLSQEDFHIREDNSPQQISYFHEVSASGAPKNQDPPPASQNQNVFSNTGQSSDSGPVMVILLDLLNTPSQDQVYARRQLVRFLEADSKKGKGTQLAICTLAEKQDPHLQFIQGFTGDRRVLINAANGNRLSAKSESWQLSQQDLRSSMGTVKGLTEADQGWVGLLHGLEAVQAQEQATDTDARVGLTSNAMIQLARYLAAIPGRKNLVWLSGSFPVSFYNDDGLNPVSQYRNYSGLVKEVSRLLAKSQVAVYPVDVRGLTNSIGVSDNEVGLAPHGSGTQADIGTPAPNGETISSPYVDFQQQQMQGLSVQAGERRSIGQIAEGTGGTAFYSANDIAKAITTASEQGSNYYSISYSPTNKNYDGRFRRIKVSLGGKGYHLTYRPGYFADDPYSPARNKEVAHNIRVVAMEHGSPLSHQIHFSARVVPVGTEKKVDGAKVGLLQPVSAKKSAALPEVRVQHHTIDYSIDSADVRFLTLVNGTYRSALMFMIASFDADGHPLAGSAKVGTSDLQPDLYKDALTNGIRVHQEVDVPANAASIRIGIQDQLSNFVGTLDIALPIPVPPEAPRVVKNQLPDIEPN